MSFCLSGRTSGRVLTGGVVLSFTLLWGVAQAQEQSEWASGENLYNKVCGYCHKPEVGVGPVLEGRELPPAYIKTIVRNGLQAMPAFPASYIDDESLEQVADYLSSLPPPAEQP